MSRYEYVVMTSAPFVQSRLRINQIINQADDPFDLSQLVENEKNLGQKLHL